MLFKSNLIFLVSSHGVTCDKVGVIDCLPYTTIHPSSSFLLSQAEMPAARRALWEQLFADFPQFDDCRNFKATYGGLTPDFKHRETGEGLW